MDDQWEASSTLFVTTEDSDHTQVDSDTQLFILEEELHRISRAQADAVYAELTNADIDVGMSFPLYDIVYPHILKNQRGALYRSTLTYLRLEAAYEQVTPDVIRCDDALDQETQAVVRDFCDSYDVQLDASGGHVSKLGAVKRFLVCSFFLIPFFTDQLASLVLNKLTTASTDTDVVFVPALGRTSSMTPVLRKASFEFEVVITSMASSWLWGVRNDDFADYTQRPISEFSSLRLIGHQLSLFFHIGVNILYGDELSTELQRILTENVGADLNRAVRYSIHNGFRTRLFGSIFYYPLFDSLLDTVDTERVVVGKMSPGGRAIVAASIDNGVDIYDIPHGTGSADCPNPPAEVVELTSGEFDNRYYSESPQVRTPWQRIATGRPYLTELHKEHGGAPNLSSSEPYRLLLATQPFRYREAFVRDVIRAAEETAVEFEIVIKIHPSENRNFYAAYEESYSTVTVSEGDLFENLDDADLTLTVYSNVGLESIIAGTPCAIVNRWDPLSPIPIYARYGPVENLRTTDQIVEFLDDVDSGMLSELLETQRDAMYDGYEITADTARNMVEAIDPDPVYKE